MPNILGLKDWKVLSRQESTTDMKVDVQYTPPPDVCPRCGVENPSIYKHDVRKQEFMDTPVHGKRVHLIVQRQRYMCRECDQTFQQLLPDMDDSRNMTKRLREYIERLSILKTFTEVAHEVGVDEKTVRNIFYPYVAKLDAERVLMAPEWLGIDELDLLKVFRCMLTDAKRRTILDVLPKRDKVSVSKWMFQLPGKKDVQVVTMDMWKPYRDAANANMPDAKVVVDKFHVVRMANNALNKLRVALKDDLPSATRRVLKKDRFILLKRRHEINEFQRMLIGAWEPIIPGVLAAYEAKEEFYDIYDQSADKKEALERYDAWRKKLTPALEYAFLDLVRACDNWKPEIFNYFESRATNAYTESVNGLAKIKNRVGRGYSFDAIRAKILYGGKRQKADTVYVSVALAKRHKFETLERWDRPPKLHREKPTRDK